MAEFTCAASMALPFLSPPGQCPVLTLGQPRAPKNPP
ncbi:hypothetical protein PF010_g3690 [Phytophthora fragariae]|uniref:Uncharacterized protein n=1 Tax=Phytophthora fragariae TaxID=53985 RepID=A0A6G0LTG6_9STRA|nr:hypothetical protein PF010_g3690 [Phytophthora fragariae]